MTSINDSKGIPDLSTLPVGVLTRPFIIKPWSLGELPREAESGASLSPSEQYRLRGGRAGGLGLCRGGVAFTLLQMHHTQQP